MKKTIVFIAFTVASMLTKAQQAPTGYLSLNNGIGAPLGSYARNYAQGGRTTNLSFAMPIKDKGWGISVLFGYGVNSFDILSFKHDFSTNPYYNYDARIYSSYTNTTFMVGGFYTIPKNKISYDFVMQMGLLGSTFPNIVVGITDNFGNTSAAGIAGARSTGFGINMGAGIRYALHPKFALCATANWLNGSATYNTTITNCTDDGYGGLTVTHMQTSFNRRINLFNITLGVAWQFASNKKN